MAALPRPTAQLIILVAEAPGMVRMGKVHRATFRQSCVESHLRVTITRPHRVVSRDIILQGRAAGGTASRLLVCSADFECLLIR